MIIRCDQKFTVILTYNDSGTASRTLILSCSISEKARDLLYTDRSDRNDRGHRRLCNSGYCSALCYDAFHTGFCGTAICAFFCTGNSFCFSDLCTAAVIISVFICRNIYSLKNSTCHQSKDHCQGNGCCSLLSKAAVPASMSCLRFMRFLRWNTSSRIISCLRLMHFIMCIFRFFLKTGIILKIAAVCSISVTVLLHSPACGIWMSHWFLCNIYIFSTVICSTAGICISKSIQRFLFCWNIFVYLWQIFIPSVFFTHDPGAPFSNFSYAICFIKNSLTGNCVQTVIYT